MGLFLDEPGFELRGYSELFGINRFDQASKATVEFLKFVGIRRSLPRGKPVYLIPAQRGKSQPVAVGNYIRIHDYGIHG